MRRSCAVRAMTSRWSLATRCSTRSPIPRDFAARRSALWPAGHARPHRDRLRRPPASLRARNFGSAACSIPHDKGLSGHSDADVALHAITDAVARHDRRRRYRTAFSAERSRNGAAQSSAQFLRHAASGLVTAQGGIIDFVDLTIICEAPGYSLGRASRGDPRQYRHVAALLALPREQVSVKATTTERLGFTGRGEGMAARTATIRIPETSHDPQRVPDSTRYGRRTPWIPSSRPSWSKRRAR